jgi:hypothetical protein
MTCYSLDGDQAETVESRLAPELLASDWVLSRGNVRMAASFCYVQTVRRIET